MPGPITSTIRWHDEVSDGRAAGPDIEVFPFQDGIQRLAHMKNYLVGLGAEKDHMLLGEAADVVGKLTIGTRAIRPGQINSPADHQAGNYQTEGIRQQARQPLLAFLQVTFTEAAEPERCAWIGRQQ